MKTLAEHWDQILIHECHLPSTQNPNGHSCEECIEALLAILSAANEERSKKENAKTHQ